MSHTAASLPPGRYGRSRWAGPRRWKRWTYAAVAVVAACGAALLAYINFGAEPISAERIGFERQSDNSMELTIRVTRDEPQEPAVCLVRVRDTSGAEGGRKEVYVQPSDDDVVVSTVIQSAAPPVTAEPYACSYEVPDYLVRTGEPRSDDAG